MRRLKAVGLVVVTVLGVGAMAVAPAGAAKANLVLREGGEHLYEGLDRFSRPSPYRDQL